MKAHKSRDVSIFSISGTQNSPGSSLLPCEAWEKVAEGRMRALSRSERGFQQHLLTGKEPSPALRAPSPILRTVEGECLEEARRLIHFPRTALPASGRVIERLILQSGSHLQDGRDAVHLGLGDIGILRRREVDSRILRRIGE